MGSIIPAHVGVFLAIIVCAALLGGGEGRAVVQVVSPTLTAAVGSSVLFNVSYSVQRASNSPSTDIEWMFRRGGGNEVRVAEHKQGITTHHEYGNRVQLFPANGSMVLHSLAKKDSGSYTVSVTDTVDGGKERKQIQLTVLHPVGTVSLSPTPALSADTWLPGHNVSLSCSVLSGDEVVLSWTRRGEPVVGASATRALRLGNDNTTLAIDGLLAADAGTYSCIASNRVSRKEANFVVTVGGNGAARLGHTAGAILLLLSCLLSVASVATP